MNITVKEKNLIKDESNDENYIISEVIINEDNLNKKIRIINSFNELQRYFFIELEDEYNYKNEKNLDNV